jgi:hypothetical protein
MERLFSPCTRLRDLAENRGQIEGYTDRDAVESLQELGHAESEHVDTHHRFASQL